MYTCVRTRICMRNLCGIVPLSVLASAYYRWCHQAQGCALGGRVLADTSC